jgi:hypothetical protein
MREMIVWSTTAEKIEQRRHVSVALAPVYEISWHTTDNREALEHKLKSNETGSVPTIRLIEIDKESTKITRDEIGRSRTTVESKSQNELNLYIGLLTAPHKAEDVFDKTFLSTFDGIITQSYAMADAIALTTLIPVKSLPLSNLQLQSMQRYFVDEFSAFIKSIRLAKTAANTMKTVSDELSYLGVDNDSFVVDSVAKVLSQLWCAT